MGGKRQAERLRKPKGPARRAEGEEVREGKTPGRRPARGDPLEEGQEGEAPPSFWKPLLQSSQRSLAPSLSPS